MFLAVSHDAFMSPREPSAMGEDDSQRAPARSTCAAAPAAALQLVMCVSTEVEGTSPAPP